MTYREPERTTIRRIPTILVVSLFVVGAAIAASFAYPLLSSGSASSAASSSPPASSASLAASTIKIVRREHGGAPGEADGVLPDRATVFDEEYPGIANLDPDLLQALRRTAPEAASDEVEIFITSGWRSRKYQEQLFRQAVSKYGSAEEAAQWVATPGTSAHEAGNAVDIGPFGAAAWLSEHGAAYGLCQIYTNEPWHYELRPGAIDHGCPPVYADPTDDSTSLEH